jgi:hypothetical protein
LLQSNIVSSWVLSAAGICLIVSACGGRVTSDPKECPKGSQDCSCRADGSCGGGLTCVSDRCVEALAPRPEDSGSAAAAGASGKLPVLDDSGSVDDSSALDHASGEQACTAPLPPLACLWVHPGWDVVYEGCLQSVVAGPRRVNTLLVLDASGSMDGNLNDRGTSKWDAVATVLSEAWAGVPRSLCIGLELFPASATDVPIGADCTDRCCEMPAHAELNVPIGPALQTVPLILDTLSSTTPAGGTPTATALARALDYLSVGAGSALADERVVLLITDGGPNCNPDVTCDCEACTRTTESTDCEQVYNPCHTRNDACLDDRETLLRIEELRGAGVRTLVVGLPGTERYADLFDEFAVAGDLVSGTGDRRYFAVSAAGGVEELARVLGDVVTRLAQLGRGRFGSCEIDVTALLQRNYENLAAAVEEPMNLAIDCELVPPNAPHDDLNWDLSLGEGGQTASVVLLGTVCERIQEGRASRIDIMTCPPPIAW